MSRRRPFTTPHRLARRLLCAACLSGLLPLAGAQSPPWPAKPVRVVVAFTPGGTNDILARVLSQKLGESLGQPFVVDNRPGGGANIGTAEVVRAAPDGYTIIVNSVGPMAVNPTLYKNLTFDAQKDLAPVVHLADVPNVLVVPAALPARTLQEFTAYAKAHPDGLSYGSTGVGTSNHLASFMLSQRMGVQPVHVPYKGYTALTDLMAGRLQFMFATVPSVIQHIRSGKLRALAVTSEKRTPSLPDVPTVAESGFPGFSADAWFGVYAPKGTPAAIVTRLNRAVNDALPALKEPMMREGADTVGGSVEQFVRFNRQEYEKWGGIVRDSGAVAE